MCLIHNAAHSSCTLGRSEALKMATIRQTTAAVAFALALVSRASVAQQGASVSLTHTVTVSVPPRVKVQVSPAQTQLQSATGRTGLAVTVNATRGWVLVVRSKNGTPPAGQWVTKAGDRSSSTVLFHNKAWQRSLEMGGASDSEPVMLTVVAP